MSYGTRYTELVVWYHLEEVKNFFSKWTMPSKSRWANVDEWNKFAKLEPFKPKIGSRDSSRNRTNGSRGSRGHNRGSQYTGTVVVGEVEEATRTPIQTGRQKIMTTMGVQQVTQEEIVKENPHTKISKD